MNKEEDMPTRNNGSIGQRVGFTFFSFWIWKHTQV